MPCRDYETDYGRSRIEYVDNPEIKKRLDHVSSLLCFVMTKLEEDIPRKAKSLQMLKTTKSSELREWWENHKKEDAKEEARLKSLRENRIKKEKALAKLNPEERRLLGLRFK